MYDAVSDKCLAAAAAKLFANDYIIVASPFTGCITRDIYEVDHVLSGTFIIFFYSRVTLLPFGSYKIYIRATHKHK